MFSPIFAARRWTPLVNKPRLWLRTGGGLLYQDTGTATPTAANIDPIGHWLDGSGFAKSVTQGSAVNQPFLSAASLNGRDTVATDGDDAMGVSGFVIGGGLPFTIFLGRRVVKQRLLAAVGAPDHQ
jgi:hypothetical protein